jgi:hypothetical protein
MSSNIANQVAFLRTTWQFPEDISSLKEELDRSYLETASCVNARIIGIFTVNKPAINGESWFITKNQKQQGLRQVYDVTSTSPINHGINFSRISRFTRAYGAYTDGTNWYGFIFGSNVAIAGQISFYITPTQIVFLSGGGEPSLTLGTVVLEWISFP